ncbi:MAG: DMT family transporter [Anaerovoracaceae bacterium]
MNTKKIISNILLLITAIIWGSAFVALQVGMDYIGPLTFSASRFWLATLVLIPVVYIIEKTNNNTQKKTDNAEVTPTAEEIKKARRIFVVASFLCGGSLFFASILQQFGLIYTTVGKAGFITALYIVLVPIFSLFLKQRPELKSWIGVAFGSIGLYLLCITESFTIALGDFVVLMGAFFWASHVLIIDYFLPYVNALKLSLAQFTVCASFSTIGMLIFEKPSLEAIYSCAVPILYAGILSGGVGFTFQILAQKHTTPTVASLVLSLESVFAAIFGFLILGEIMTHRELLGCVLMFIAIILSQLPNKIFKKFT